MSARFQQVTLRVFQYTLALVVLLLSIKTAVHRMFDEPRSLHTILLSGFAGLEACAAVFFVFRSTMKPAGYALLGLFVFAFFFHGLHGDWNLPLLVFASGVAVVLAQR